MALVSNFIPNTTVTFWRTPEDTNDDYDDPIDDETVLAADIPGYLIERDQRSYDPASGKVTIIEAYQLRVRPVTGEGVDLSPTEGDRVKDLLDGEIYTVGSVNKPKGIVGSPSITMLLWKRKN